MTQQQAITIIIDFIQSTPIWYNQLHPKIKEKECMICGIDPGRMLVLAEALKVIVNK